MVDKDSELVERKEVLSDFGEIFNNIEDDLKMDKTGESGYATYKEVVEAIEKYTLKVIKQKYEKYGGK